MEHTNRERERGEGQSQKRKNSSRDGAAGINLLTYSSCQKFLTFDLSKKRVNVKCQAMGERMSGDQKDSANKVSGIIK